MIGLIINSGSSSLKACLIDTDLRKMLFTAKAEHLNSDSACLTLKAKHWSVLEKNNLNHQQTLDLIFKDLKKLNFDIEQLDFIAHRIVHGGTAFSEPTIITDEVLDNISACSMLAPLHNPIGVIGIKCCKKLFPGIPQIAVFDTSFHQSIPEMNFRYAVPDSLYDKGIRKYGFHGISYSFLTRELSIKVGLNNISAIIAHIGQGSSVCAVSKGKSIYTSMEFSPLTGTIMGTRSGSIDPTIVQFLHENFGYSVDKILDILNKESGLLALTGTNNMIEIIEGVDNGDKRCIFALDYFCNSIAQNMSQAIVALGEIPKQIVFTGGIGENSSIVREKILTYLKPIIGTICYPTLPISASTGFFSGFKKKSNSTEIYVIKTNEELEIALEAQSLL